MFGRATSNVSDISATSRGDSGKTVCATAPVAPARQGAQRAGPLESCVRTVFLLEDYNRWGRTLGFRRSPMV
ncbi:hypothetical protein BIFDEN_01967 [Bifidobacterium dentium ATCC 27678]|nr:hypothetical protein BIFDEN_01967 [Bifidobacterium dentium ATCC 27678]